MQSIKLLINFLGHCLFLSLILQIHKDRISLKRQILTPAKNKRAVKQFSQAPGWMSGARSRVRVRDSRKMNSQELRQVNITNNCHFHTLFSLKTRLYKKIHILLYSRLGKIFSQIMIIIFFHLNRRKKHHTYLVL